MQPVYLDNAATTPIAPEVREALDCWLREEFGNPSSRHALGVRAAEAIDRARTQVARATGARPAWVTFTSGGTEANNMAVLGAARRRGARAGRIVIGPTEHPSVRESAFALRDEGFEVSVARLDRAGALDLASFEELITPETVLVAQMLVNNEFGTVYPLREVARIVRRKAPEALLHVDAVQGLGKLELSLEELGADTLSLSAHKVHAPKGTGALVRRADVALRPLVFGGGQESTHRPGTENVAGIVGFGEAARLAETRREATVRSTTAARDVLATAIAGLEGARLLEPGAADAGVVPAVCAVLLSGAPAEVWLHHLEERGVLASSGSACQEKSHKLSAALTALGLSADEARRVLRFSFSRDTTPAEVEHAAAALVELAATLRGVRP